jgi:hypothetical protein
MNETRRGESDWFVSPMMTAVERAKPSETATRRESLVIIYSCVARKYA